MKYSAVTLLALTHGIVAAPSLLSQLGHKNTKSKPLRSGDDITLVFVPSCSEFMERPFLTQSRSLSIEISQSPMRKVLHHLGDFETCCLVCLNEETECPGDWVSKQKVKRC
ncbi:hypothetical protein ACLX1H_000739 [Fusarium chlamydosporum]